MRKSEQEAEILDVLRKEVFRLNSDIRKLKEELDDALFFRDSESHWAEQYKMERDQALHQRDAAVEALARIERQAEALLQTMAGEQGHVADARRDALRWALKMARALTGEGA